MTSAVEPHPSLIFSIKHVALDFWRWVGFNPSLTKGVHKQIVEVECAREYEGRDPNSSSCLAKPPCISSHLIPFTFPIPFDEPRGLGVDLLSL